MRFVWFDRFILGASGLLAFGIGLAIMTVPQAFYGAYGISLGSDASLLNELRAPGANLTALGAVILAGAVLRRLTRISAALGATVFLAYAFGRMVSMAVDGSPHDGLVTALMIELAIGGACVIVLSRHWAAHRLGAARAPAV